MVLVWVFLPSSISEMGIREHLCLMLHEKDKCCEVRYEGWASSWSFLALLPKAVDMICGRHFLRMIQEIGLNSKVLSALTY